MAHQTWIADACRDFGLAVEEYQGWTDRGDDSFNPGGAVAHWTAGPCNATGRPSLHTVVNGRADLPGPLANVYLDRNGVCIIVAAGRANHAGDGGYRGLSGNSSVLGVEAECCNAGDWTHAQLDAYPVLLAALVAGVGRDETWAFRHMDWTTRKIDTNDLPLDWLQAGVQDALATGGIHPPPPPREAVDMARTAVINHNGEPHYFQVSADGTLVHHYYAGGWHRDTPGGAGWDAEAGVSVLQDLNPTLPIVVVGQGDGDPDVMMITQFNAVSGRWETDARPAD